MTGNLELKFLGPPEVFHQGHQVRFITRKTLALFAYLVLETGDHPREKLQSIFWPESETRLAQSALRNTLSRIKESLRGWNEPFCMDGDRVEINFSDSIRLDLDLVLRATQPDPDGSTPVAVLEQAVSAVRGPFFEAFSLPDSPGFNDWTIRQRNAWGQRSNFIHDLLSLQQLEDHYLQPAIETVNHWLTLDHLNEKAFRRLMRLHLMLSDRSTALQVYETLECLLAEELGVAPSLETQKLLADITNDPPGPVIPLSHPVKILMKQTPFVGRSAEYRTMLQAFHKARLGGAQIVVLSGGPGYGKTRLADEFLAWANTHSADIVRSSARQHEPALPYQPVIAALRQRVESENAPEDLLDDAWLSELCLVLPELRERYPDLPMPPSDPLTSRSRLYEAIARLTTALVARQTLVWVLDDTRWACEDTRDLLLYLMRTWQSAHQPVLLLILVRSGALSHKPGLHDWIGRLNRVTPITHLALEVWQVEDLQALVSSLAGQNEAGSQELAAWLNARTGGQPRLVNEALSILEARGQLAWMEESSPARALDTPATLLNLSSMPALDLTPAITDGMLSRMEWLSQPAAAMLSAAAVIAQKCSFADLCRVSGLDEQAGMEALEELLSTRLVLEDRGNSRPYSIASPRLCETVSAQLSSARREVFQRRMLSKD